MPLRQHLLGGRRERRGVLHDGEEPRQEDHGTDREGSACDQEPPELRRLDHRAHDGEAGQHEQQEQRVGRVHDREHEPRTCDERESRAGRLVQIDEEERQRGGHEQHAPAGGRGQREQPERAAGAGRERRDADRPRERRDAEPARAEDRDARFVDDEERERREHGRFVHDDLGRVDARQLRDQREERVPERERVAGVQPAVHELAHAFERELVERQELPHAREVEQRVAGRLGEHVPEQHAGKDADPEHREPDRIPRAQRSTPEPDGDRRQSRGEQEPEGERQRRARREHDEHRAEDQRQARHDRTGGRPCEQRAGREEQERRPRQPQVELDHGFSRPRAACR